MSIFRKKSKLIGADKARKLCIEKLEKNLDRKYIDAFNEELNNPHNLSCVYIDEYTENKTLKELLWKDKGDRFVCLLCLLGYSVETTEKDNMYYSRIKIKWIIPSVTNTKEN